ncbi:hypothetical protein KGY73_01260 [bacterium]|nr:hypothetical protein [bacterium]
MKEKLIQDFLQNLNLSLKNASIYHHQHPAFKNSVQELKNTLEHLLEQVHPLKIGFTPRALLIENQYWDQDNLHLRLARFFHRRKIKNIQFHKEITPEELMFFISNLSLSPQNIIQKGGLRNIIPSDQLTHIRFEDLDYSQLLKGEGKEVKDIWSYLLKEAVEKEDAQKIGEVTQSFQKAAKELNSEDLLNNSELHQNLSKLFHHLNHNQKETFRKCGKELVKAAVRNKDISPDANLDNLKSLISDLNPEDLAATLKEEILDDPEFDSFSFTLFSKLSDKEKHHHIASSLKDMFLKSNSLQSHPQAQEKIKQTLSRSSSPVISEIYRDTLLNLIEGTSGGQELSLNLSFLSRNYRYLLLNLFDNEKERDEQISFLERISEEMEEITKEKDLQYLKSLIDSLNQKGKELLSDPVLLNINNYVSNLIEDLVLDGESLPDLDYFLGFLKESRVGMDAYLEKIFSQNNMNPSLLRLFFKLFPGYISTFKERIRDKSEDYSFLSQMAQSLGELDFSVSLELLKFIFHLGDHSVKIKTLRAMKELSTYDENFLLYNLKKGSFGLKKEALKNLKRSEITKHKAVETLFSIPSPLGFHNKELIENIEIAQASGLKESRTYLVSFTQKKFFWNKKLRKQALQALYNLNE